MEMIIIYPVFIGIAMATSQLAYYKGYSMRWWFLTGLLLPIVSLPVLFMLKKKEKPMSRFHAPVVNENKDKLLYKREQ